MWCDGVDQLSVYPSNVNCFMHDELDTSANVINYWDAEGSTPVYIRLHITDVQGCLKCNLPFWKEVLQAYTGLYRT